MTNPEAEGCELCHHKVSLVEHHRDGDVHNNEPRNRQYLCHSCHPLEHKRLGVRSNRPRGEKLADRMKRRGKRLFTFWMLKLDALRFSEECHRRGITQGEFLRTAMREYSDGHHTCDSLEEARQKECEICLSRLP